MVFIFYCVLIIFIALSPASGIRCHHRTFNNSHIFERKSFSIQVGKNRFIRMNDVYANIEIDYNNERVQYNDPNTKFIKEIEFKGHIIKDGNDNYEEKAITSLIGYQLNGKTEEICTVSFFESNDAVSGNIDEEEVAIIRYVQSCLQEYICDVNPLAVDENADTYYQSIQATLNKLVDIFALQIIKSLAPDGSIYYGNLYVGGLDTYRRTRDVSIKIRDNRIIARIPAAFDQFMLTYLKGFIGYIIESDYYAEVELRFTLFPKCAVYYEGIIHALPVHTFGLVPLGQSTIESLLEYFANISQYKTEPFFECDKYLNEYVIDKLKILIEGIGVTEN